ncbi:acylaminoacyl-peptidase [Haematococcus lacustris]
MLQRVFRYSAHSVRSLPHPKFAARAPSSKDALGPRRLCCRFPVQVLAPAPASLMSTAAATAPGPSPAAAVEMPAGMGEEARLLSQLAEVATISKVLLHCPPAPPPSPLTQRGAPRPAPSLLLQVQCSQRNLAANSQRRFALHGVLAAGGAAAQVALPMELPDALLVVPSPSGDQQLVVKAGGEGVSTILQVWNCSRLVLELHVPRTLHGPLVNDAYFGNGAAWSPDGRAVAYTAEAAPGERTPAWGGPEALKDAAGTKSWRGVAAHQEDWGELNTGKRPPQVFILDIAAATVIQASAQLPPRHSAGQPCWAPDSRALLLVAWPDSGGAAAAFGRKLGVVFCYNRPAQLWCQRLERAAEPGPDANTSPSQTTPALGAGVVGQGAAGQGEEAALRLVGEPVALTRATGSALSPRFSPSGSTLVWLSHDVAVHTSTHSATAQLLKAPWPQVLQGEAMSQMVVGVPQLPPTPDPTRARPFPGLYTALLAEQPFADESTLLLTSQWYSQTAILAVDLTSGHVCPLTPTLPAPFLGPHRTASAGLPRAPAAAVVGEGQSGLAGAGREVEAVGGLSSVSLVGVSGGRVLGLEVGPTCPARLLVAELPHTPAGGGPLFQHGRALAWQPVVGCSPLPPAPVIQLLQGLDTQVMAVQPREGTEGASGAAFESIVFSPRQRPAGGCPTVLAPHGGPHTAVTLAWYLPYAFLAHLGYAVVCPNYRGSTGYGQPALHSLPGHIGRHDVADCMAALEAAVSAGLSDPGRVAVVGGSHGGFLAGHLIGQHPTAFRAAVMRNPVCNIALMAGISDIADWCYVEVFGSEEGQRRFAPVASPEDLAAMHAASPIAHVHKVKAPVQLMLGARDRRVPPADGQQYRAALTAAGVEVRTLVFPEDSHALDKPQTEFEQWLNVASWLKAHLA